MTADELHRSCLDALAEFRRSADVTHLAAAKAALFALLDLTRPDAEVLW